MSIFDHLWQSTLVAAAIAALTLLFRHNSARIRHGLPGEAVRADHATLAGLSIYLAGPPAMVETLFPLLLGQGAERDYIYGDHPLLQP